LVMGCIDEEQVSVILAKLTEISQEFSPLNLTLTEIYNNESVGLTIEKTEELQRLHERISTALSGLLSYDATVEMLSQPAVDQEIILPYINAFKEHYSFEHYFAHITLGMGETPEVTLPIDFVASRIALGQIGDYGTCAKIFGSVDLKG